MRDAETGIPIRPDTAQPQNGRFRCNLELLFQATIREALVQSKFILKTAVDAENTEKTREVRFT
jgi:hypothetical protein